MLGVAPHGPGEMALDAGHEFVPLGQYLAGDQDAEQVVDGLGVATVHVAGKAVQILVGRRSSGGGVGKEPGGVGIADPVQYGPRLVAVGQRGPHGLEPAARRCGRGVEEGVELLVEGAAVTQPSHHGGLRVSTARAGIRVGVSRTRAVDAAAIPPGDQHPGQLARRAGAGSGSGPAVAGLADRAERPAGAHLGVGGAQCPGR